jgi:hypothetical protein
LTESHPPIVDRFCVACEAASLPWRAFQPDHLLRPIDAKPYDPKQPRIIEAASYGASRGNDQVENTRFVSSIRMGLYMARLGFTRRFRR